MRAFKIVLLIFLGLDGLYFFGSAVLLNTSFFAKVSEMKDESLTFLRFKGALSPFPGFLWFREVKVAIRDENVTLDIFAVDAFARFDILPLFHKEIQTTMLRVGQLNGNLHMKTKDESESFVIEHPPKKNEDLSRRYQLKFPVVEVGQITHAVGPWGEFDGDASVKGAFNLQPGVSAEIFPSILTVKEGHISEAFKSLSGTLKVAFSRFSIPDTSGNQVFSHLDSESKLSAILEAIQGVQVKSANEPNLHAELLVKQGMFLEGSHLSLDSSELRVDHARLKADGTGKFLWKIEDDHSILHADLKNLTIYPLGFLSQEVKIQDSSLHLLLEGNNLEHLFRGFIAEFNVRDGRLQFDLGKGKVKGQARGGGTLYGKVGAISNFRNRNLKLKTSKLSVRISPAKVDLPSFPTVDVEGTLSLLFKPIILESRSVQFNKIESQWVAKLKRHGEVGVNINVPELSYIHAPDPAWRGKVKVTLSSTNPFVDELQEEKKLSSVVAGLMRVSQVTGDIDVEFGEGRSFVKVNEINSSGIWKASGALMSNSFSGKDEITGAFEVKVAGLPVGIRITPKGTETTFLPSKDWYPNMEETFFPKYGIELHL